METMALFIFNSAKAKRKAGKNVPKKAETAIHFHCCFLIFDRLLAPINNRKIPAKKVRKAPNCKGVKPNNPFLIKMKELPQTKERATK